MIRRIAGAALVFMMVAVLTLAAKADDIAYMETGASEFGTIDLNTGVFTLIAPNPIRVGGLAEFGGNFYGWGDGANTVYKFDPSTGTETSVGNGTLVSGFGNMASGANGLFGIDAAGSGNMYSIDPTTGAPTFVGGGLDGYRGIGNGVGDTIYVTFDDGLGGSILYSVNTHTAARTLIGNTGVKLIGATVWVNGTLWAGTSQGKIYTLDPNTGIGTFVANLSGTSGDFWGLGVISQTTTPEPSSILLLGSGLVSVLTAVRRKLSKI